jgi:hypothetical protein
MEKKTAIIIAVAVVILLVLIAIVVLPIMGVVLWQMGVFSPASSGPPNRAIGFSNIRPIDSGIQYGSDGDFSFTVVNAAGVTVNDVTFSFSRDCEGETYTLDELYPGDSAEISVMCTSKSPGSRFSTDVSITYNTEIAGTTLTKEDEGQIMGTVE